MARREMVSTSGRRKGKSILAKYIERQFINAIHQPTLVESLKENERLRMKSKEFLKKI